MRLLDRYLLRQLLGPFLYCLFAFSMMVVVYDLFDHFAEILKAKPDVALVARYYVGVLLPSLDFLLPACLLLASLYALWQLTRSNELIAMRCSGISFLRIMLSFASVGLVVSILSAVVGETLTPQATRWSDEFYRNKFHVREKNIQENRPYYNIRANRQWVIGELDLKQPSRMKNVQVIQERPDETRIREYLAERAEWLDGEWWFYGVREQAFNTEGNPVGSSRVLDPDAGKAIQMPFLTERPDDIANDIMAWEYSNSRDLRRFIRLTKGNTSASARAEKRTKFYQRLAMPWACLVVTLFGIPAGTRNARQGALTGIFVAIGFFLCFYAVTQVGLFLAMKQVLPPWLGAWMANIAFLAAGIYMLIRLR